MRTISKPSVEAAANGKSWGTLQWLFWGSLALAAIGGLVLLSRENTVVQAFAGVVVSLASFVYPPASAVLLALVQFTPLVLFHGVRQVPGNIYLFGVLMGINGARRLFHLGDWQPHGELYIPRGMLVVAFLLPFFVLATTAWDINEEYGFSIFGSSYHTIVFSMGLLVALQLRTRNDQRVLLAATIVTTVVMGLFMARMDVSLSEKEFQRGMELADPNYYCCAMGFGIIAAVAFMVNGPFYKQLWLKVILAGLIAASGLGFVRLGSRGASVALVLALCVVLAMRYRKPWQFLSVGVLLVIVAPMVWEMSWFDPLRKRFEEVIVSGNLAGNRSVLITDSLTAMGNASPINWLFGFGQGGPLLLLHGLGTHNIYLGMLLSYGFVGTALLGWLLWKMLWAAIRTPGYWGYVQVGLICFFLFCGLSLEPQEGYYPWLVMGIMLPQVRANGPRPDNNARRLRPMNARRVKL